MDLILKITTIIKIYLLLMLIVATTMLSLQAFSQEVISRKEYKRIYQKKNKQTKVVEDKKINWLDAIGKAMNSNEVKMITNKLGKPSKLNDSDEFLVAFSKVIVKPWHNEGLRLCFKKQDEQTLKWIYFFPENETNVECKTFLPFGFSFTDSPADLRIKYNNVTKKGDSYWIIIDSVKYPNIIFKVNYSKENITSATLSR